MRTDEALRIPGTANRHGPTHGDWMRLASKLAPHYAGGLFTILQVDKRNGFVRRAFSSNPDKYALGGTKHLVQTPWGKHVIEEARCFIAATSNEMEGAFSDHQLLYELGCTTALNIPLRQGADIAWTVNLLRGGAPYTVAESLLVRESISTWIAGMGEPQALERSK